MRLNSNRVLLAGLVIASAALVMQAQSATGLSGTWKMNAVQSRFSDPGTAPKEVILKFDQQGQTLHETLTVVNAGGKSTVSLNYALSGGVITNSVDGDEIKATAAWSGEMLCSNGEITAALLHAESDSLTTLRK